MSAELVGVHEDVLARDAPPDRWSATSLAPPLHFGRHPALLEAAAHRLIPFRPTEGAIRYTAAYAEVAGGAGPARVFRPAGEIDAVRA